MTIIAGGSATKQDASGRNIVVGPVAHDAVAAGNPLGLGGFATQDISAEADVAAGDCAHFLTTLKGAQLMAGGKSLFDGFSGGFIAAIGENDDELPLAVGLYVRAPDANSDRLRALGDTVGLGTGVLAAAPWIPGASAVKSVRDTTVSDSTTRVTSLTPTSGKKIRIISLNATWNNVAEGLLEIYFGTGATISTNAGKEIAQFDMDLDNIATYSMVWPDGGGPVGAVDDVVSMRTGGNISTSGMILIHYREE